MQKATNVSDSREGHGIDGVHAPFSAGATSCSVSKLRFLRSTNSGAAVCRQGKVTVSTVF